MRWLLALVFAGAAWGAGCDSVASHQFDFWLGEWDVQVAGHVVAHSRIERLEGGCIIQENWMPFGAPEGKSWNFYNAALGKWEQVWVTAQGGVLEVAGNWEKGAMREQGEWHRHSFTPLPDGSVRQFCEESSDQGRTWHTAFDGLYVRRR
jgi:hypothetical protein